MSWRALLIAAVLLALAVIAVVTLAARSRPAVTVRNLRKLEDQGFRSRLAAAFTRRGWHVTHRDEPDDPAQLELSGSGQRYLVQCRHWRARFVGGVPIGELARAVGAEAADGGYAVTTGRFTRDARSAAGRAGIELIDGAALERLLSE